MIYLFNGKEYKTLQAFFVAECPLWTAEASWDGSYEEIALCDSVNCFKNIFGIALGCFEGKPELLKIRITEMNTLLEQLKEKHDFELYYKQNS